MYALVYLTHMLDLALCHLLVSVLGSGIVPTQLSITEFRVSYRIKFICLFSSFVGQLIVHCLPVVTETEYIVCENYQYIIFIKRPNNVLLVASNLKAHGLIVCRLKYYQVVHSYERLQSLHGVYM